MEEPRTATVTVLSPTGARCLRLRKARFDEMMHSTSRLMAQARSILGQTALDNVSMFKYVCTVDDDMCRR